MGEKIVELMEEIDKLKLQVTELEKRVHDLETGSIGTGIYLDGAPEYVRDYINKEGEE